MKPNNTKEGNFWKRKPKAKKSSEKSKKSEAQSPKEQPISQIQPDLTRPDDHPSQSVRMWRVGLSNRHVTRGSDRNRPGLTRVEPYTAECIVVVACDIGGYNVEH